MKTENRLKNNFRQTKSNWESEARPVEELPVFSAPAVSEFLCVHSSNSIQIWLINPQQAEAIDLPKTWNADGNIFIV